METMKDFEKELEASFRKINVGDIIKAAVIAVSEEEITLDLNYYTQGIIKLENFSNDPDFAVLEEIHVGDEIRVVFGKRVLKVRVLSTEEVKKKKDASDMYEVIEEGFVS